MKSNQKSWGFTLFNYKFLKFYYYREKFLSFISYFVVKYYKKDWIFMRADGRKNDETRKVKFTKNYTKYKIHPTLPK